MRTNKDKIVAAIKARIEKKALARIEKPKEKKKKKKKKKAKKEKKK